MITSRLDKSKHFELVFSWIGGLEPDLWILEDLDIFGVFVVFFGGIKNVWQVPKSWSEYTMTQHTKSLSKYITDELKLVKLIK